MYGGYANKILRVNLSESTYDIESLDRNMIMKYIGGSGLGTKMLYDETKADLKPLSPESPLIFMTGPLTGSGVPGSGRHEVVFKSPLTNLFGRSGVGGSWGVNLKRSGFDGIIITGRSEKLTYLFIYNGEVKFCDASHLRSKDTYETEQIIKKETNDKATAAVIGPAGEQMIKISCISHDGNHARVAGRCGGGAVMGSKNLKAIVVYGTQPVEIAHPDELKAYIKENLHYIKEVTKGMNEFGTSGGIMNYEKLGNFPHKNWTLSNWEEGALKITGQEMAKTILVGKYACRHCPVACGRVVKIDKGAYAPVDGGGPEYETLGALGGNCLVDNLEAIAKANELCNRFGLDTMSTGGVIGFAMEAYEKGLIDKDDTGGIELNWGNGDALIQMIEKIAKREDIGKLLGEGVREAALGVGKNSVEFAVQSKGLSPSYHDPRCFFSQALNYATYSRGPCHNGSQSHSCEMKTTQPDIGINEPQDRHQVDGKAEFTIKLQNLMCLFDALVLCKFMHTSGAIKVQPMLNFFNYVTGFNVGIEEFMKTGERIFNLQRLYNTRCGISRKDDTLHPRFLTLKRDRDELPPIGKLLSDYYELRGWNEEGLPIGSKLKDLNI